MNLFSSCYLFLTFLGTISVIYASPFPTSPDFSSGLGPNGVAAPASLGVEDSSNIEQKIGGTTPSMFSGYSISELPDSGRYIGQLVPEVWACEGEKVAACCQGPVGGPMQLINCQYGEYNRKLRKGSMSLGVCLADLDYSICW